MLQLYIAEDIMYQRIFNATFNRNNLTIEYVDLLLLVILRALRFLIIKTSKNIANAVQEDDTSSLSMEWLRLMMRWRVQPPPDESSRRDKPRNTYDFYEQTRDSARAHCKPRSRIIYTNEIIEKWSIIERMTHRKAIRKCQ